MKFFKLLGISLLLFQNFSFCVKTNHIEQNKRNIKPAEMLFYLKHNKLPDTSFVSENNDQQICIAYDGVCFDLSQTPFIDISFLKGATFLNGLLLVKLISHSLKIDKFIPKVQPIRFEPGVIYCELINRPSEQKILSLLHKASNGKSTRYYINLNQELMHYTYNKRLPYIPTLPIIVHENKSLLFEPELPTFVVHGLRSRKKF